MVLTLCLLPSKLRRLFGSDPVVPHPVGPERYAVPHRRSDSGILDEFGKLFMPRQQLMVPRPPRLYLITLKKQNILSYRTRNGTLIFNTNILTYIIMYSFENFLTYEYMQKLVAKIHKSG